MKGKTHSSSILRSQNISKITGWDGYYGRHSSGCSGCLKVSREVVNDLGRNTSEVDRVDRPDIMFLLKFQIAGKLLDHLLTVVKSPVDRNIEYAVLYDGGHLTALKGRDTAIWSWCSCWWITRRI